MSCVKDFFSILYIYEEFKDNLHCVIDINEYLQELWPTEDFGKGSLIVMICTTYVIPLAIIIVCYYRIVRNIWHGRSYGHEVRSNDLGNWSFALDLKIVNFSLMSCQRKKLIPMYTKVQKKGYRISYYIIS